MMAAFHRLRRDEDGQALVLAAVFGLVLMLCVLGTVNLGRTVYDKVQLQGAADAAAYSQAAVEARVLNFTAYTNRAMVVHYASLMAATSYLTWVHFNWAGVRGLLDVLRFVPYVGAVFETLEQVFRTVVHVLDVALWAYAPLIAAANTVLYGLQEGAWWSVYLGRLASALPPEARSGSPPERPYRALWPAAVSAANQAVFAQTRGHLTMPQDTAETSRILVHARDPAVQMARLHMLEVANSARHPWVAYGDREKKPSVSLLARHFRWKIGCAQLGTVARTELGSFPPEAGSSGAQGNASAQIWSGERLQALADCRVLGIRLRKRVGLFSFVAMDQLFAAKPPHENSYFQVWSPRGVSGKVLTWIVPGLGGALHAAKAYAEQTRPLPGTEPRAFWLSPYVYFSPRAASRPDAGPAGHLGNFAQPDVLVALAKDPPDLDAEPGSSTSYRRRFSWNGRRGVDFRSTDDAGTKIPGLPGGLQLLSRGLNAVAAAQVYYHRPGEWKEMPNFFNPLWSARLMPVLESNAAAKLGLTSVPLLRQLLLH